MWGQTDKWSTAAEKQNQNLYFVIGKYLSIVVTFLQFAAYQQMFEDKMQKTWFFKNPIYFYFMAKTEFLRNPIHFISVMAPDILYENLAFDFSEPT